MGAWLPLQDPHNVDVDVDVLSTALNHRDVVDPNYGTAS